MGGPSPRIGLNLKVAQKQILTPGLVQMVSVLALNKLELREMINQEMISNPVLEEVPEDVPSLEDVAKKTEAESSAELLHRASRPRRQRLRTPSNKSTLDHSLTITLTRVTNPPPRKLSRNPRLRISFPSPPPFPTTWNGN